MGYFRTRISKASTQPEDLAMQMRQIEKIVRIFKLNAKETEKLRTVWRRLKKQLTPGTTL